MSRWNEVFTERQLLTLTTFSRLVRETRNVIIADGADEQYADAICTYLAFAVSRVADSGNTFSVWESGGNKVAAAFSRQGLGMVWDFPEANPFSDATQNWRSQVNWVAKVVDRLPHGVNVGSVYQADATTTIHAQSGPIIVTDPPYYDSIYYSDTSDFFYAWLRSMLRDIYPELFTGILTPKDEEMIANRYRFEESKKRFEDMLGKALSLIRDRCSPDFPSSIFYAYKQKEEQSEGLTSTGWESMLTALVSSGFRIVSTWPMRTENTRALKANRNQLASSIVLVCRPRSEDAPVATRRHFLNELERALPPALDHLTRDGHIAPVDLAQAAIGPGMQVYSKYSRVETIGGDPVPVRDALIEINRVIAEYHRTEQGELDSASQFCVSWLQQFGYAEEEYGEAEVLAQAKNVAIEAAPLNGLLTSGGGRVKLVRMDEFSPHRPLSGGMTAWEGCMRMAYHLHSEDGLQIDGAAEVARAMSGSQSGIDAVERLARILYAHYDRKGDSPSAVTFNTLASLWQDILVRMRSPQAPTLL